MPLARYMRPTIVKLGMLTMVTSLSGGGNQEPPRTYVRSHGPDAKEHTGIHVGHKHTRLGRVEITESSWTSDGERYRGPDLRRPRRR